MADESVKFKFDLDAKEALGALTEIKEKISKLGESKSLDGLVSGFIALSGPIFAAGAAIAVMKAAFDLTLEGEALDKVQNQFNALAGSAGINAEKLESGIKKAIGTTVDLDEALGVAKKAIVSLGPSADKIPQIFELSRKAAATFGGTVTGAFEDISGAMAAGNTRALRHYGIIIDQNKAYKDYANSIGQTVSALSDQEKKTAVMNAALAQGKEKFKGIKTEGETVTKMVAEAKVAWKEFTDALARWVAHSGIVKAALVGIRDGVSLVTDYFKKNFGDGVEHATNKVEVLRKELRGLIADQIKLGEGHGQRKSSTGEFLAGDAEQKSIEAKISATKAALEAAKSELTTKKDDLNKKEVVVGDDGRKEIDAQALALRKEQKSKFEKELFQLTVDRYKAEEEVETDAQKMRFNLDMQQIAMEQEQNAKIELIRAQGEQEGELGVHRAAQLIEQLELDKVAKIEAFERKKQDAMLKTYDNQIKSATKASNVIAAAALKDSMSMSSVAAKGTFAYGLMKNSAVSFFKTLGTSSESVAEQMKKAMFGALGEYAMHEGEVMLARGLGHAFGGIPGAGGEIAQGGALISLGSLISSLGGSSSSPASGGGGGGGSAGGIGAGVGQSLTPPTLNEQQKKSVTIQVQGSYFETEQTKQRLVDLIRQESDATDFKYQQIGVG
jgi:hypothetical protein